MPSTLLFDGWTSNLQQLPPFTYGCLYAHLVTYSKTIAENQRCTAAATFNYGCLYAHLVTYSKTIAENQRCTAAATFNYGCLYAHLVTYSKTIAENQRCTAAATFGAGAMKHKEDGHRLFPDDHVRMDEFQTGFAKDSHCLFHGIVKPSFKTTGSYSTVLALSKISGCILGAQCNCKDRAGGCCKHVTHCCVLNWS